MRVVQVGDRSLQIVRALPGLDGATGETGQSGVFTLGAGFTLPASHLSTVTVTLTTGTLNSGDTVGVFVQGHLCILNNTSGTITIRRYLPAAASASILSSAVATVVPVPATVFPVAVNFTIPTSGYVDVTLNTPTSYATGHTVFVTIVGVPGSINKQATANVWRFTPTAYPVATIAVDCLINYFTVTVQLNSLNPLKIGSATLTEPGTNELTVDKPIFDSDKLKSKEIPYLDGTIKYSFTDDGDYISVFILSDGALGSLVRMILPNDSDIVKGKYPWTITDSLGNMAFTVDDSGISWLYQAVLAKQLEILPSGKDGFYFTDELGAIAAKIDINGVVSFPGTELGGSSKKISVSSGGVIFIGQNNQIYRQFETGIPKQITFLGQNSDPDVQGSQVFFVSTRAGSEFWRMELDGTKQIPYDYSGSNLDSAVTYQVIVAGQSNAQGYNTATIITPTQSYGHLQLAQGTHPFRLPTLYGNLLDALTALSEQVESFMFDGTYYSSDTRSRGQTLSSPMAIQLSKKLEQATDIGFQQLHTNVALSGRIVADLSAGSSFPVGNNTTLSAGITIPTSGSVTVPLVNATLLADGASALCTINRRTIGTLSRSGSTYTFTPAVNPLSTVAVSSGTEVSTPAIGQTPAAQWPTGFGWASTIAAVTAAKRKLNALSKTHRVAAVVHLHGESDVANASYDTVTRAYWQSYQNEIKPITGQSESIPFLITQWSGHAKTGAAPVAALKQLALSETYPSDFTLICPVYFVDFQTDGGHITSTAQVLLGEYAACAYESVILKEKPWLPLKPLSASISGAVITVNFNVPAPPLVFDSALVAEVANMGFEYTDDSSPPAISGVAIVGNSVRVTLATAPTGGNKKIRYAYTGVSGANGGRLTGARGNLRDSCETVGASSGSRLYNWCVHFDIPIT